jgi:hypothetical protein
MIFYTAENEDIQLSYEELTCNKTPKKSYSARNRPNNSRTSKKKGGESLWRRIHHLIKLIWTQYKLPEEWCTEILQPIYKKGDKLECSSCRAVTLLNVTKSCQVFYTID